MMEIMKFGSEKKKKKDKLPSAVFDWSIHTRPNHRLKKKKREKAKHHGNAEYL